MIKNNNFYINNLRDIIILGESQRLKELISINKHLNLNTTIITSSHQSKLIDKKIKYKIFDNLSEDLKKFVKKNFKIKNTLFISLGARYIFKKDTKGIGYYLDNV